jgi:hypothetical protein
VSLGGLSAGCGDSPRLSVGIEIETDTISSPESREPLRVGPNALSVVGARADQYVTNEHWALAKTVYDASRAVIDDLLEYRHEMAQAKADASAEASATREARGHLANADDNIRRIAIWLHTGSRNTGRTPWGSSESRFRA